MRPPSSCISRAVPAAILGALLAVPAALPAAAERVEPGSTVKEVLAGTPAAAPAGGDGLSGATAALLRVGGWTFLAIIVALVSAILWRRFSSPLRRGDGGGELEVLAHKALTPRHSVLLLSTCGFRVVLGIAGERMTTVAVFEEEGMKPVNGTAAARNGETREVFRAPGRNGAGLPVEDSLPREGTPIRTEDLEPYRRQVARLRGLLQGSSRERREERHGSLEA